MKVPMRQKYVDEAVGVWILFGMHPSGAVDIADQNHDVFTELEPDVAERVIAAQEEFREKLYDILCKEQPSEDT